MKKLADEKTLEDMPLDALILLVKEEKYRLSYSAIRWAKEIKQKESLPDSISSLIPRSMREILGGKVSLKEIEKLPMVVKIATPPPSTPTLTLNVPAKEEGESTKAEV